MIIEHFQLKALGKKVVMVDGGFDPIHKGHIKYFEEAAKLGCPVLCNVQSDGYIIESKKRANILPEEQRTIVIDALKAISYVHLCTTSTHDVLEQLKPAKYIKGLDWKSRGLPEKELEVCNKYGIEIVYLDTNIETSTNISASYSLRREEKDNAPDINEFERTVLSQKIVESDHYDDHYFVDGWREGDNDYTIQTRRKKEGKNPQNIKDVFDPKRALDLGCGPGALMYLLHELGVESYGIDFSKAVKEIAPKEVRDKIHVGSVAEYHDFGFNFDLVICRELLEHLTVLQVRQAISVMAKYSSKFIYVTTRYHPNPKSLLDITDDKVNDPSHISVLNKEFMRVLFILEGLKSRPDLEEKLDWKKYGRVIVMEKTTK